VAFAPKVMVGLAMDGSPIFMSISSSWPCATATDASPSSAATAKVTYFVRMGIIEGRQKRVLGVVQAGERCTDVQSFREVIFVVRSQGKEKSE
jgi:hypothetical protein